jgi:hypothetical protein
MADDSNLEVAYLVNLIQETLLMWGKGPIKMSYWREYSYEEQKKLKFSYWIFFDEFI